MMATGHVYWYMTRDISQGTCVLKDPLCLGNGIIFISKKTVYFGILLPFPKNILICYIHDLYLASLVLLAIGIVIVNKYLVWKTKYYTLFTF
jgi:hypothetical protein